MRSEVRRTDWSVDAVHVETDGLRCLHTEELCFRPLWLNTPWIAESSALDCRYRNGTIGQFDGFDAKPLLIHGYTSRLYEFQKFAQPHPDLYLKAQSVSFGCSEAEVFQAIHQRHNAPVQRSIFILITLRRSSASSAMGRHRMWLPFYKPSI